MLAVIKSWIWGVLGASILTGIAVNLTPKGKVRTVLYLTCGTVMVISLVRPVLGFDMDVYAINMAEYRESAEALTEAFASENDRLEGVIIEEGCEAYILDKAQVFNLEIEDVRMCAKRGDDGLWIPYEVFLVSPGGEAWKLRDNIEAELGIPPERQHWSNVDEH